MSDKRPSSEELRKLYSEDNLTIEDLARKYDVGSTTISRWFRNYQIAARPSQESRFKRRGIKLIASILIEGYNSGDSLEKLADENRVDKHTISILLRKNGVSIRRRKLPDDFVKPTKDEMNDLYNNQKLSIHDIAEKLRVGDTTIKNLAREYKIPMRTTSEALTLKKTPKGLVIPSKNELSELYNALSSRKIARQYGISVSKVYDWLDKYKILRKVTFKVNVENGKWGDLDFVLEQVRSFLSKNPDYKKLPSADTLRKEKLSSLASAIGMHGGFPHFRDLLEERMSGRTEAQQLSSLLEKYVSGGNQDE